LQLKEVQCTEENVEFDFYFVLKITKML